MNKLNGLFALVVLSLITSVSVASSGYNSADPGLSDDNNGQYSQYAKTDEGEAEKGAPTKVASAEGTKTCNCNMSQVSLGASTVPDKASGSAVPATANGTDGAKSGL